MASKRFNKVEVSIDGTDFSCHARSVTIQPGDILTFCENEWEIEIEFATSFGASGSWNLLDALRNQVVTWVVYPGDGTVASDANPGATFDALVPPIPFLTDAQRQGRSTFTIETVAEAEPVYDTGA